MTEQTRSDRRIVSNRPLQLRCPDWQDFVRTYARDISSGGMFIQTEEAPPILSFLEVRVDLPDGDELMLNARVVHIVTREQVGPHGVAGIGVEFRDLTPGIREQLAQLVRVAASERPRSPSGVHSLDLAGQARADEHASKRESQRPTRPAPPMPDDQGLMVDGEPTVPIPLEGLAESSRPAHEPSTSAPPRRPSTPSLRAPTVPSFQAVMFKPPPAASGHGAKEEKATILRLSEQLKTFSAQTDHEILGVDPRVDEGSLRAAFIARSKEFHPDLFAQYTTPEVRQLATQIFVRIKQAFTHLNDKIKQRDPAAAAASLARVLGGARPNSSDRPVLRSPVSTGDESGSVVALISDAKRHVAHKRYEEAQRTLEKALSIDPNHSEVKIWFYTVRARRLKLEGDTQNAQEHYRLVLELDEKNLEAARELRNTTGTTVFGIRLTKD